MSNKKARGRKAKTRDLLKKKGSKTTVNKLLQVIEIGSKVDIKSDPSVQSGMPDKRYHGFTGTVTKRQGKAYVVEIRNGGQDLKLILGAAHLTVSASQAKSVKEAVGVKA